MSNCLLPEDVSTYGVLIQQKYLHLCSSLATRAFALRDDLGDVALDALKDIHGCGVPVPVPARIPVSLALLLVDDQSISYSTTATVKHGSSYRRRVFVEDVALSCQAGG